LRFDLIQYLSKDGKEPKLVLKEPNQNPTFQSKQENELELKPKVLGFSHSRNINFA